MVVLVYENLVQAIKQKYLFKIWTCLISMKRFQRLKCCVMVCIIFHLKASQIWLVLMTTPYRMNNPAIRCMGGI
ncbi:hypothetical protein QJS10_CPA02g01363 [Acorus calamus]|uniref:Uncharacterized protein n=1 Tax=Acorus calamus TaxID=4465 RepID=A0AAV9FH46_ACOCL|nr:hypothetical protein QJS10_CPA02g01363 [Acorus calamus]